jgi:hypothetical protein
MAQDKELVPVQVTVGDTELKIGFLSTTWAPERQEISDDGLSMTTIVGHNDMHVDFHTNDHVDGGKR